MKKIVIFLLAITIMPFVSMGFNNNVQFDPIEPQESEDCVYFQIVEMNSKQMVIDVFKNSAVDDFCSFLGRKDIAASVALWCVFMPGNPVCTAYGVAMVACQVYGAVRLVIEGDFSNAIIETISASTKVYKMSKVNSQKYKIE